MRKLWLFAAVLAGSPPIHAATEDTPRCSSSFECEVMWAEAQKAVEFISDMRLRMVTETRLETYPPMRIGRVGAIVTREPVAPGVYEARYQAICYGSTPCFSLNESGRRFFNLRVNGRMELAKPMPGEPPAIPAK